MINALLLYQFALLYCPVLVIGLVIYGSDFKGASGWIYLGAIAGFTLLHLSRTWWMYRLGRFASIIILISGVVVGILAYRELHLRYWDEHSISQAVLISVLGLCSLLASVIAATRVAPEDLSHSKLARSLLLFTVVWWLAYAYPIIAVFAVVLILGVATVWLEEVREPAASGENRRLMGRYALFVFVMDAALAVWDFKVDSSWAFYLAFSLLSAALGVWIVRRWQDRMVLMIYGLAMANFIFAVVYPAYVISYLHSILAGLAIGVSLSNLQHNARGQPLNEVLNYWPPILLAFALSYGFYAHLTIAHWRIVFLVLLLGMFIYRARRGITSGQVNNSQENNSKVKNVG